MQDVRGSNLRSRVPEQSGVDCADIFFGLRLRRPRRRQTTRRQLLQASLNSPPRRDSNPRPAALHWNRNPQGMAEAENSSTSGRRNDHIVGIDENAASLSILTLSDENASLQEDVDGGGARFSRTVERHESTSADRLFPAACDERNLSECGNEEFPAVAEIFKCFICLGKVVDAQLCPCCSKLVCSLCIRHWLLEHKSQCPHCRMPLLVSQLVNCKFISEIMEELDKMCGKAITRHSDKICLIHDSPLSYFCLTCSSPVCSDCAVLDEDHHNHSFESMVTTYGRHKKKINQEAVSLRQHLQELSSSVKAIDENIESVLKAKDASLEELQKSYESIQKRLEEQLKSKLTTLLAQKGSVTHDVELVKTVLHELDNQLNKLPKTDLIAQEPMICNMLQDIRSRTLTEGQQTLVSTEFISEVVPSYDYGELVIKNFTSHLNSAKAQAFHFKYNFHANRATDANKEIIEKAFASGVIWRLKVYPNGSGASKRAHVSVFLEMLEGNEEPSVYEYIIEMLHQSCPYQNVVRKSSSIFEVGASWGYYEFFPFDLLKREGYLLPKEDAITFRVYVRALPLQHYEGLLLRLFLAITPENVKPSWKSSKFRSSS